MSRAPSINKEERKRETNNNVNKGGANKQLETYQNFFETSKLGMFPRVNDDNLSESSDDEKNQLLQLDEIQTIAGNDG